LNKTKFDREGKKNAVASVDGSVYIFDIGEVILLIFFFFFSLANKKIFFFFRWLFQTQMIGTLFKEF